MTDIKDNNLIAKLVNSLNFFFNFLRIQTVSKKLHWTDQKNYWIKDNYLPAIKSHIDLLNVQRQYVLKEVKL